MNDAIEIKGLKEVQKALYSYSQQLGDRVVLAALRQGANLIKKTAVANAPRGETGALKKSFRVSRSKIHRGKMSGDMIGVYLTIRKGGGRKDPKDAFYGRWIESGWNVRGKARESYILRGRKRLIRGLDEKKRGRTSAPGIRDIPGQKFIERAFLANRESALRLIIQATERGAEVVARKTRLK